MILATIDAVRLGRDISSNCLGLSSVQPSGAIAKIA
jgi:hypothetical protein